MRKILRIRLLIIVFISNLLVIFSYELKPAVIQLNGIPSWLIATVTLTLGISLTIFMVDSLFKFRTARKWAIGNSWVEGFWLIRTYDENTKHPITNPGVLSIQYNVAENEVKAVTTRIDENGNKYVVNSEFAYVRAEGANVNYLNYFKLSHMRTGVEYGVAYASFSSTTHSGYPDTYTGSIALQTEGVLRVQSARRITDEEIKKYKDQNEDWIAKLLIEEAKKISPLSVA